MVREIEGVQKDEVVLQCVSKYMKERLPLSCQELDDVEGQLDLSLEEASLLTWTCENQIWHLREGERGGERETMRGGGRGRSHHDG